MKKGIIIFILFNIVSIFAIFAQGVDVEAPKGTTQVIDDFENGNYWIWAGSDWDRYGGHKYSDGCGLSKKHVSQGKYSMELLCEPVVPGANATFFYDGNQDLSGAKWIVLDVYSEHPKGFSLNLVLQATDNWNWLQTESYWITPGAHKVVYYVGHINENFNDVRRFNVNMWFNEAVKQESSVYIDNIYFIK